MYRTNQKVAVRSGPSYVATARGVVSSYKGSFVLIRCMTPFGWWEPTWCHESGRRASCVERYRCGAASRVYNRQLEVERRQSEIRARLP